MKCGSDTGEMHLIKMLLLRAEILNPGNYWLFVVPLAGVRECEHD